MSSPLEVRDKILGSTSGIIRTPVLTAKPMGTSGGKTVPVVERVEQTETKDVESQVEQKETKDAECQVPKTGTKDAECQVDKTGTKDVECQVSKTETKDMACQVDMPCMCKVRALVESC